MVLDKEKEMIKEGLRKLKERQGFEELLKSPPTLYNLITSHGKDNLMAERFRREGNNLFKQSNHDVCVHYDVISSYNKSVGSAPPNSESLALAHGNRSAIFEHIGKYKESIVAIDKAIRITKSLPLRVKLLCRKAKCAAALGLSDAIEYLAQARSCFNKLDRAEKMKNTLEAMMNTTEAVLEKRTQNPSRSDDKILEASNCILKNPILCTECVETVYSERYGRHLVASQDIESGKILMVENTINSPPSGQQVALYCWHCSSFLWDIVPCDSCFLCCFCSEQCKVESWKKYHEIGCRILPALVIIYQHLQDCDSKERPLINQLGMRIFITALKQSGGVCKLRAALESFEISKDQEWAKSLPEDDYRHVYALSSNMKQYDLDALIKNTALNLVILAKHTSIFKKVFDPHDFTLDRLMRNDDILYVGAVLLKFCAVCDTHCIDNYRNYDCKKEEPCNTIGCGLLSWSLGTKTSLARRNCVPNIMRCMIESNKVILYSIRPIKRGAQIIDSHASWKYSRYNIFINVPEAERKADFQERYGFFCECQACVEDWPAMNFEKNFDDFYKEVVPSATEKSLKMLDDFFMLSKRDSDLTLVERISGFSRLIQHSVENFPLPSKVTAFMIRGFIVFMSLNCEISNQFQIADKCVPSA